MFSKDILTLSLRQENGSKRKGMRGDKAPTLQPVLALLAVKTYHLQLELLRDLGMFLALMITLIAKLRLSKLLFVVGAALEAPETHEVRL